MAITAQNASYLTQGPAASGQVFAPNEASNLELALAGTATFTLDGTLTAATLNFIDGTKTLSFTPTGVLAFAIGGTQQATAAIGVTSTVVVDNKTATINFSGAGTATKTLTVLFFVVK